jgi:hypothetical protein
MENTINLNEKSTIELKAIAYDILSAIEKNQHDLRMVNQAIEAKSKEVLTPVEED